MRSAGRYRPHRLVGRRMHLSTSTFGSHLSRLVSHLAWGFDHGRRGTGSPSVELSRLRCTTVCLLVAPLWGTECHGATVTNRQGCAYQIVRLEPVGYCRDPTRREHSGTNPAPSRSLLKKARSKPPACTSLSQTRPRGHPCCGGGRCRRGSSPIGARLSTDVRTRVVARVGVGSD